MVELLRAYSDFVPKAADHSRRLRNSSDCNTYSDLDPEITDLSYDPEYVKKELKQLQNRNLRTFVEPMSEKYMNGASIYELAEEYGCHRSTVSRVLKESGIMVSNKASDRPALIRKVLDMYADYMRPVDIGRELGINEATVRKILRANNVHIRHSSEYSKH